MGRALWGALWPKLALDRCPQVMWDKIPSDYSQGTVKADNLSLGWRPGDCLLEPQGSAPVEQREGNKTYWAFGRAPPTESKLALVWGQEHSPPGQP